MQDSDLEFPVLNNARYSPAYFSVSLCEVARVESYKNAQESNVTETMTIIVALSLVLYYYFVTVRNSENELIDH